MREAYRRCSHCLSPYICLLSGYSPRTDHTDERFCPKCLRVVREALAQVPKKYERAQVETTDVDLRTLLDWEQAWATEVSSRGGLPIRRVSMPLFNLTTGQSDQSGFVSGRGEFAGRGFHYRFWPGREGEAEIKEEVERNLETGEVRPWQTLRSE